MAAVAPGTPRLNIPLIDRPLMADLARTIRGLAIDGIEKAKSGHPGLPLGCADFAAVLLYYHLRYDPKAPKWADRDRFVLSAGHGSMLLYAMLHVAGYDLSIDDLKAFRQLHSKTPGHPENFMFEGVETTTGPLGQGVGNAVGMGLAAHMMAARFPEVMDHHIYCLLGDGDLMEGVAAEAASFAGHHRLGRLVFFYDDNKISLDGPTSFTFSSEDVGKRFEAYGWHVLKVNGHDAQQVHEALIEAKADPRPSLIIGRTHIGYGSPNKQDSAESHGSPLGPDETKLTKKFHGLDPEKSFFVPDSDRAAWAKRAEQGAAARAAWQAKVDALDPKRRAEFDAYWNKTTPDLSAARPSFKVGEAVATRKSASVAENAYAPHVPWLVGGSADLDSSCFTAIKGSPDVTAADFSGRNIRFGVREHAMASMMNGIALHGAFRPFGSTFFTFADYMKPAIRLAALMKIPAIYVFTHDSIFLGEDGPTHQSIEQLAMLRAIPNMTVIRPADADEAAYAWEMTLKNPNAGPTALVLSRQNLPTWDRKAEMLSPVDPHMERGAYILWRGTGALDLQLILIATGSEVSLALDAARKLDAEGIGVRVVSMPSWELFRAQPQAIRDHVLPPTVRKRLVVEAGVRQGWDEFATDGGDYVVMSSFGASAPAKDLAKEFGFTVENVIAKAKALLAR